MDVRYSRVLAALRDALLHKLVSGEMMAQTRSHGGQGNYPTWPGKIRSDSGRAFPTI